MKTPQPKTPRAPQSSPKSPTEQEQNKPETLSYFDQLGAAVDKYQVPDRGVGGWSGGTMNDGMIKVNLYLVAQVRKLLIRGLNRKNDWDQSKKIKDRQYFRPRT